MEEGVLSFSRWNSVLQGLGDSGDVARLGGKNVCKENVSSVSGPREGWRIILENLTDGAFLRMAVERLEALGFSAIKAIQRSTMRRTSALRTVGISRTWAVRSGTIDVGGERLGFNCKGGAVIAKIEPREVDSEDG